MSDETDTFWVSLSEKFFGILLIIIGALLLYYTATSPQLAAFATLFGILSIIVLAIGIFLLIVKPPQ